MRHRAVEQSGLEHVVAESCCVHYITLETIYSGLSKSNFKDHYGDVVMTQFPGRIAEINEFSASDKML